MTNNEIMRIGFLIFPGFPMSCLTSMIEPLRAANEIAGMSAFSWALVSEHAGRVMSSADVVFEAEHALSTCKDIDALILLSSPTARFSDPQNGNGKLRAMARHGTILGGISGGVFPLTRAGVMQGHAVSVHWCYEAAYRAEFPDMKAVGDVIVTEERRLTVSGAAGAFDLALRLTEQKLGPDVAHEVACWFQHPSMRGEGVQQRVPRAQMPKTGDGLPELVANAVEIFATRISDPVTIAEIAEKTGVTPRQIERAFKKATGQSPSHYYRTMRMNAARQLVVYSKENLTDVALAVGYGSATPMIAHYKAEFGISPKEDRKRANQFRVEGNSPVPSS